ncbi:MAG: DUF2807 domain-containing protein [Chloroflexales bacterium]
MPARVIALLLGLLLSGCGSAMLGHDPGALVEGSGPVIREERPVSGVSAVEFGAFGNLEIIQGDEEGLTLQAQGDILPMIASEVDGDTLRIYAKGNVSPKLGIQMRLKVRSLRSIMAGGSGNITVMGLSGDTLSVRVIGANAVTVAGSVREQTVSLTGAGTYDGGALESQRATVTIDGFADALVRVSEQLRTSISGPGTVEYFGEPRLIDDNTGLGQVMRRTR